MVEGCSTREFHLALRRFVATCGRPAIIYSDNATYFATSNRQLQTLKNLDLKEIQRQEFTGYAIEWQFSTPEAPWTNGITERMVGIFKKQLHVLLQMNVMTLRALETLSAEITSAINDRPLGTIDQDHDNWSEMITPNMLQLGRNLTPLQAPGTQVLENLPCSELWIRQKKLDGKPITSKN